MSAAIRRVAVLGAGAMGAAIAAHCANAGLSVLLLDLAPADLTPAEAAKGLTLDSRAVRDRVVRAGFDRMRQARPPALFSAATADLIALGNVDDDFARIGEADWIVEAIIEQLAAKRALMARIDAARKPGSIVSSNTSGIPLRRIAEGRSADFRAHFLGAHFFNPPRYMRLLELIPTADTDPAVLRRLRAAGEDLLGKGVVVCKDTPNFIGNRIYTFGGLDTMRYAVDRGYTIEEVDALTGPLIGRPRTASFRLADLAGLDILAAVADNLHAAVPDDESREVFVVPPVVARLVREGRLGTKTGAGFYRRVDGPAGRREFHVLDLATFDYRPPRPPDLPLIAEAGAIRDLGERLRFILGRADAGDRAAALIEAAIVPTLAYAARRIPEISDDIAAVDDAMRWGFAHQLGPFETWDALGVAATAARMERSGIAVAGWVTAMLVGGGATFYRQEGGRRLAYSPLTKRYESAARPADAIDLEALRAAGRELAARPGASVIDLGDGVLGLEFHSKANAIGRDGRRLLDRALDLLDEEDAWRALVIGNQGDYFSAGVDLTEVGGLLRSGDEAALLADLKASHDQIQRVRFAAKPVVVAPFGHTLGLGVELCLAAAGVCAEGETAMGLVEVGVGLIPGAGGCKEMVRRIVSPPMRVPGADPLPYLRRVFDLLGQGKVSGSAVEARELGFLAAGDRIVLGRQRLLAEAKRLALDLAAAGYRPPAPGKTCYAAGAPALAALRIVIHQFKIGGYISDYDAEIGLALARVLCGGELSAPQWVDEEYLLELERAEFARLARRPETQARIAHMLDTGQRLRN
jgi:3-hydroxyacyl-CoA dehydrogenase